MTSYVPPPYAPGETKELMYPSVHDDPQQQQQPLGVYPQQGSPAAPGMASVTYYPPGPQQQQPQQLVISQPAPVVVQSQQQQRVQAFAWHVAVSCCVVFCCCCPCGLLAFILASKTYSDFIGVRSFDWEVANTISESDKSVYTFIRETASRCKLVPMFTCDRKISEIILLHFNYRYCMQQKINNFVH